MLYLLQDVLFNWFLFRKLNTYTYIGISHSLNEVLNYFYYTYIRRLLKMKKMLLANSKFYLKTISTGGYVTIVIVWNVLCDITCVIEVAFNINWSIRTFFRDHEQRLIWMITFKKGLRGFLYCPLYRKGRILIRI